MYTDCMKTPKRLKKNLLIDVVAEVRFESQIPPDAIVGLVYSAMKEEFGAPESLPILQLPTAMRDQDPVLRYQSCYRFQRENHITKTKKPNKLAFLFITPAPSRSTPQANRRVAASHSCHCAAAMPLLPASRTTPHQEDRRSRLLPENSAVARVRSGSVRAD